MSLPDGIEFLADGIAIGEEHIAFADTWNRITPRLWVDKSLATN